MGPVEPYAVVDHLTPEHWDQRQMPHLADKFRRYDLFAERFPLSCLNRLQLRDNRQMIDLQNQTEQLVLVGTLDNPIARFRPAGRSVA